MRCMMFFQNIFKLKIYQNNIFFIFYILYFFMLAQHNYQKKYIKH
jgi:hypothetical protein